MIEPAIYGPPTTRQNTGAGGPFNYWDIRINAALRRGNPLLADELREARALVCLTFGVLEPAWVPTKGQRALYNFTSNLRSGVEGLRVVEATGWERAEQATDNFGGQNV